MLKYQDNPNEFAVSLLNAPGKEPLACAATCLTACCGLPACYYRKKALETLGRGMEDYVCCQGYIPGMCGFEPGSQCQGQMAGLLLEVRATSLQSQHPHDMCSLALTHAPTPSSPYDHPRFDRCRAAAARRSPSRSRACSSWTRASSTLTRWTTS